MAERKRKPQPDEHTPEQPKLVPVLSPGDRLRLIFDDLRAYAPPEDEDDGWDAFAQAIDAERPDGMKLYSK